LVDNPDKPWQFQKGNPGKPSLYRPEYGRQVHDRMAEGYTMTAAAAELNVSVSTLQLWQRNHPEFKEMVELGRVKRQLWWETKLMTTGNSAHVAASLKALGNMKADDWIESNTVKLEHSHEHSLKLDKMSDNELEQLAIIVNRQNALVIEHDDNEEGAD
jgi:hypothetical protein